ncbi:MAG TPA: DUF5819 family protein [Chloroflexota bacterium]|jgi:hypothetical protein
MRSGPKLWPTVVRVAALAWLVVHFTLTVAYVMPLNPVTAAMEPLLRATIGTYFPQGWAFFAPDPGWSVPVLLARPLSPAEAAALPARGLPADGWYDLSTPLWERFHANRLSAYARIAYPQLRATLTYGSGGDRALAAEACPPGSAPPCEPADPRAEVARAHAAQLLARIASAFCNEVLPDREVSHVALRVRERPIAPWAERYGEPPPAREVDLGIFPVDRAQTAGGFWRDERPE